MQRVIHLYRNKNRIFNMLEGLYAYVSDTDYMFDDVLWLDESFRDLCDILHSRLMIFRMPEIKDMKGFQQHNFHHIYDVLTHTAVVIESTPPLLHLRLAALFHDIAKPRCFTSDEKGGHFYGHEKLGEEIEIN